MTTSFIEQHEEQQAKDLIKQELGFAPPRACGNYIYAKIYVRPDQISCEIDPVSGNQIKFYLPESVTVHDKFNNCVGLVIDMGPSVFKSKYFEDEGGPRCKVGDWIVFPRNSGTQINYRGIPVQLFMDERVCSCVEDPTYVTRD